MAGAPEKGQTMSNVTTTIRLLFQGVPVDITLEDLQRLKEIRDGLILAKQLGFEGQPLRLGGGFSGGKGAGRPAPVTPVRDAQGRLCCPTHAGDKRGALQKKEWANGTVWACGCKDDEAGWCKYKLDAAQYDQFEQAVPKAAPKADPAPQAQAQPPKTPAEARSRFFARFKTRLGGDTWAIVQAFWGEDIPEPQTINEWTEEAKQLAKALSQRAA
jgi:hypothetical protein